MWIGFRVILLLKCIGAIGGPWRLRTSEAGSPLVKLSKAARSEEIISSAKAVTSNFFFRTCIEYLFLLSRSFDLICAHSSIKNVMEETYTLTHGSTYALGQFLPEILGCD